MLSQSCAHIVPLAHSDLLTIYDVFTSFPLSILYINWTPVIPWHMLLLQNHPNAKLKSL